VRADGRVVASAALTIDGGTALLNGLTTEPASRGRGHGDAVLRTAVAVAAEAGCDLVVLDTLAHDWPQHWFARRGFADVTRGWTAHRREVAGTRTE
jgi:N-acetylglutamate synthase-like GNAT family acetyltransferase